jgi:predicted nuclease of predicted toxin-antitoxin system
MRFKLDENLDPCFSAPLVTAGHDVASVRAQGLGGRSDDVIYGVCVSEQRTLITLDLDFSNPVRFPVVGTPGIIVLGPSKVTLPLIGIASRLARAVGNAVAKWRAMGCPVRAATDFHARRDGPGLSRASI